MTANGTTKCETALGTGYLDADVRPESGGRSVESELLAVDLDSSTRRAGFRFGPLESVLHLPRHVVQPSDEVAGPCRGLGDAPLDAAKRLMFGRLEAELSFLATAVDGVQPELLADLLDGRRSTLDFVYRAVECPQGGALGREGPFGESDPDRGLVVPAEKRPEPIGLVPGGPKQALIGQRPEPDLTELRRGPQCGERTG